MSCIMANTIQSITCNKHSQSKTSGNVQLDCQQTVCCAQLSLSKYSIHIGHPHCLPLVNHSCSKIKLKGERSCVRLYTAKQYKHMHLSSVPRSLVQPEGSCNRRRASHQYKHKIISMQIHAPFKHSKKFGSAKVAARIWREDGVTIQAQNKMQYKYMH